MFARVSDKFHNRKQQASPLKSPQSPPANAVSPGSAVSPTNSTTLPQSMNQGAAPSPGATQSVQPPQPVASMSAPAQPGMEGVESVASPQSMAGPAGGQPYEVNRTMSIEMADVSNLSLQTPTETRQGSVEEERMREKARSAQEQAQANLHHATQQARVAAINAAATQAALDTATNPSTGSKTPVSGRGQALRKTAGRYALGDFHIERTFYAIKVLNKEKVVKMKQVEHTNSEREMLVRVRHPFLVNLWGTFQDVNNLYMVMDFVAGGELFSLLRKSQFYAAEVALALDYLHSLDIIYRDLKPENILLGADGHVKVTDFGFAKHVPDITWTLCGTPDYLVQSKGYNKSVDWYALGVLIFEMLAGYPPFFTEDGNPMKLYEKVRRQVVNTDQQIIAGKVRYPTYFDALAKELLKNLLVGDLTKRYGNLRAGSADIFAHGWFAEVDWDKLYRREIPAPYVPKIEGEGDASQFPSKLTALQHPELSRHLRVGAGESASRPLFPKDSKRNQVERKTIVALALLRSHPFRSLPLHVRCFREDVHQSFTALAQPDNGAPALFKSTPAAIIAGVKALPELDPRVQVTFNPSGYAASFKRGRIESDDQLDLKDDGFRNGDRSGEKWKRLQQTSGQRRCYLCAAEVDTKVRVSPLVC
ncbi:hypothetical protein A1Q2_06415 [Trichosporon asahii var. asahii CBS 8904]|uniref:cAMP-dependent protein kinase n=1 Tax=Trichosporon asahii var. asahii (strain CBS 8904) TaxID=1220162 RepID=K1VEE4_TRIAC|nr:hypothetical protein A1Q2_06415 [Trichosporon asahii var. asahii CBS 8904]